MKTELFQINDVTDNFLAQVSLKDKSKGTSQSFWRCQISVRSADREHLMGLQSENIALTFLRVL